MVNRPSCLTTVVYRRVTLGTSATISIRFASSALPHANLATNLSTNAPLASLIITYTEVHAESSVPRITLSIMRPHGNAIGASIIVRLAKGLSTNALRVFQVSS